MITKLFAWGGGDLRGVAKKRPIKKQRPPQKTASQAQTLGHIFEGNF
jgi:hypothetical protein